MENKTHLFVGVVLLIFILSATHGIWQLIQESKKSNPRRTTETDWHISQTLFELQRFQLALEQFHYHRESIDRDGLILRFDIFWSRIFHLSGKVNKDIISQISPKTGLATIQRSLQTLTAIEHRVFNLNAEDRTSFQIISHALQDLNEPLRQLTQDASRYFQALAEKQKIRQKEIYRQIILHFIGLLISGGGLSFLLVRELRKTYRSRQQTETQRIDQEKLKTLNKVSATVSHELRNPLGSMRTSTHIIRQLTDLDNSDPRLSKALLRIDRSIDRCNRIVDEFLHFTSISQLQLESIKIDEWLEKLIRNYPKPATIRLQTQFQLADIDLSIDPHYLHQALINIIENAYQALLTDDATNEGNRTEKIMSMTTTAEAERAVITIHDNGPGISADILPYVFEPLFSNKNFGIGLGLSTSKKIIERHGGGITLNSVLHHGTEVVLWLPLNELSLPQK